MRLRNGWNAVPVIKKRVIVIPGTRSKPSGNDFACKSQEQMDVMVLFKFFNLPST